MSAHRLAGPHRSLLRGALVFRWVGLVWMTVLAATSADTVRNGALAWLLVGLAGAWTVRFTVEQEAGLGPWTLYTDLAISFAIVLLSGLVEEPGGTVNGSPFFGTAYPVAAIIQWGVQWGPGAGLGAGGVLGIALVFSRPLNGVPLATLQRTELQSIATGVLLYMAAGLSVGLVSRVLRQSEEDVRVATSRAIREHERAARLAERESMARQIHDSVLQALALVHKRGREIAAARRVDRAAIAELADLAADQEAALRSLIMREPDEVPAGAVALRDELERASRETQGVNVAVSTVGPILVERSASDELVAAVRQLLQNVANHAGTERATVFAEVDDGTLAITVRDDGVGFTFDQSTLRERGKAGLLKSVIGRVEDLGGTVRIKTAPGEGTLVEILVRVAPAREGAR